jgi:hypothetical protein
MDLKLNQVVFTTNIKEWILTHQLCQIFGYGLDCENFLIQDRNGNKITEIYELYCKLPFNAKAEQDKEYEWDDAYIEELGNTKILSLKYVYDVIETYSNEIIISGKEIAKAILKDVKSGSIKFFDKEGNVKDV